MARIDVSEPERGSQLRHEQHSDGLQTFPAQIQLPKSLIERVDACLSVGDIHSARTLVANAGSEVSGDRWQVVELAKAHIAAATGDFLAAQAILVMALERASTDQSLRVYLAEVMLAAGRATDIRPVLAHVGPRTSATVHKRMTD